MAEIASMDLIVLADDEGNSVSVKVLGRHRSWPNALAAQIVVETPFVRGRIDLALWTSNLREWAQALDRLGAGEDIAWMRMSRGPSVFIQLTGERDCPEVVVEDEFGSMVTVRVPVVLPEDWVTQHRQRVHALVAACG
ncbi:hypothetical protein C1I95_01175 [Micromonospora craterilacus]|uniref:Uncharacterized protein n=1 Tax=Micromonospora craterilacus TaxID=1655439 RepID=A0A2W2EP18_9ACTN|nr:DUF5959 family protein [Micromonospora craterilacus]PZG24153.1 hypothetical protein C1I95_01175 [Micromonospora craterilacus]